MSEDISQVNPDYVDAPYEAYGCERGPFGKLYWFTDREISRDPIMGIIVERTDQDTGRVMGRFPLDPGVAAREASRPARPIRFHRWKKREKLKNCVPYRPGVDSFENLPTPTGRK